MNVFTIYPAIDLRGGKVVRLQEGDLRRQTTYSDDPRDIARQWLEAGARWLHVVNLDGAFDESDIRNQSALDSLLKVTRSFEARVQFGGGLRSLDMVEQVVEAGVNRVVLGTVAIEQPEVIAEAVQRFGPEKIAVGIDARDGQVRIHGWQSSSGLTAGDLGRRMRDSGVRTVVFTDISRDGMGGGLNVTATRELAAMTGLDVIASGGVRTAEDVDAARAAQLAGVIIGRALYDGTVDLKQALDSNVS